MFPLCAILVSCSQLQAVEQPGVVLSDAVGDTFGAGAILHDITAVEVTISAELISFDIRFSAPVASPSAFLANSVVGYIDLDVDRNVATGAPSQASVFSPTSPDGIGSEYYVDFFSEQFSPGKAELIDTATMLPVGNANLRVTGELLSIEVPLTHLGGDGAMNFSIIAGTFNEFNDVVSVVPEPTGILLALLGLPLLLGRHALQNKRP
jgi:hypothetical protein